MLGRLRALPSSAFRALATAVGFVVVVSALFAGIGAWQDRGSASPDVAAPEPTPAPAPAPAPEDPDTGDADPDGEDERDGDAPDTPDATAEAPEPAPEPTPAPEPVGPAPSTVSVQVLNAIGSDGSAATGRVESSLRDAGFRIVAVRDASRVYDDTTVFYTVGFEAEGQVVGRSLNVTRVLPMTDLPPERRLTSNVMVHVVVGVDRR
jgi:hypothetical protein